MNEKDIRDGYSRQYGIRGDRSTVVTWDHGVARFKAGVDFALSPARVIDLDRLPLSVKADVLDYEEANGKLPAYTVSAVLNAYLSWNGLIGFTESICTIIGVEK